MKIRRPFAVCAFAMLLSCSISLTLGKDLLLCILILSALICLILTLTKSSYSKHCLLFTAVSIIACLLSSLSLGTVLAEQSLEGAERKISGTVYDYPTIRQEDDFYVILNNCTVNGKEITGKIKAYIPHTADIDTGEILSFSPSFVFANVSDGIFKYHKVSSKISLVAATDFSEYTKCGTDKSYIFLDKIHNLKEKISDTILSKTDTEKASVIISLITGETDILPESTKTNLRISGISHIFAISGMHLSLWTGIFFIIFRQRAKSRILPNIMALAFVIFYCIFTGLSPSVLRSGIMLICVFTARILRRYADPLNSLGFAVCLLLFCNPFLSGNVSFLLSVAATFALVAFIPEIINFHGIASKKFRFVKQKLKSIPDNLLVSLSVILVTLPICAVFFGYISLVSPASSLIITPLAEILMILSVPAVITPSGTFINDSLIELTDFFSSVILKIITFFSDFTFAVIPAEKTFVLPWFIFSTAAVIGVRFIYKNKQKTLTCVLICTLVLTSVNAFTFSLHKNETKLYIPGGENITFISIIGKSDTTAAVYGCGGSFSAYRKTSEYLNRNAILRTDALIIPRNTATESNNMNRMTEVFQPKSLIELIPKNAVTGELSGTLWKNTSITAESNKDFSAAILYIDRIKIVICSLPTSDFNSKDKVFQSADILITRNAIPTTLNTKDFKDIIVVTDRNIPLPENAVSSKNSDIEIIIEGDKYVINR